jgi:hypothetical protein
MLFGRGIGERLYRKTGIADRSARFEMAGFRRPAPGHDGNGLLMDPDQRKAIETLIGLAGSSDPSGCWDPERAVVLLRNRSTRKELQELGASEALIDEIWPETREG